MMVHFLFMENDANYSHYCGCGTPMMMCFEDDLEAAKKEFVEMLHKFVEENDVFFDANDHYLYEVKVVSRRVRSKDRIAAAKRFGFDVDSHWEFSKVRL